MSKPKQKRGLRIGVFTFLVVMLLLNGSDLFTTGRGYTRVTNYDLLVRDVSKGDENILIPEMEAFPEGEYYCHVSYAGKWPGRPAEGYLILPKGADGTAGVQGYSVKCHPADEYELEPNTTFLDVPMYLGETAPDKIKDGFWVRQFIFELDGYTYWVRFESRQGVVENVQPTLEKLTRALLGEEVVLEGAWEHVTTVNFLGIGVEEPTQQTTTQRFEFREDGTGEIITRFHDDHPAPPDIHFHYILEDNIVTIVRDDGGGDMVFAVTYHDDSLHMENQRGTFDLTRIG